MAWTKEMTERWNAAFGLAGRTPVSTARNLVGCDLPVVSTRSVLAEERRRLEELEQRQRQREEGLLSDIAAEIVHGLNGADVTAFYKQGSHNGSPFKDEVVARLEKGETIIALAREYNLAKSTVRNWANKYVKEGRVCGYGNRRKLYANPHREEALQDLLNGVAVEDVMDKYDVARSTLHKWCERRGIEWKDLTVKKKPGHGGFIVHPMREAAVKMLRDGEYISVIERKLGVSNTTLTIWRREEGIPENAPDSKLQRLLENADKVTVGQLRRLDAKMRYKFLRAVGLIRK